MKVILNCTLDIDDSYSDIKKLEHHIDWLFDLSSYPEIKSVKDVTIDRGCDESSIYPNQIKCYEKNVFIASYLKIC